MMRKAEVRQAERDLFQAVRTWLSTKNTVGLRMIANNPPTVLEAMHAEEAALKALLWAAVDWQEKVEEYDAQISCRFAGRNRSPSGPVTMFTDVSRKRR